MNWLNWFECHIYLSISRELLAIYYNLRRQVECIIVQHQSVLCYYSFEWTMDFLFKGQHMPTNMYIFYFIISWKPRSVFTYQVQCVWIQSQLQVKWQNRQWHKFLVGHQYTEYSRVKRNGESHLCALPYSSPKVISILGRVLKSPIK